MAVETTCTGQQDVFGQPYNSGTMADLCTAGRTWVGGTWSTSLWTGHQLDRLTLGG